MNNNMNIYKEEDTEFPFSLAVDDLSDVSAEAKKVLQGDTIINRLPLCVEISLKTVDNDQLVLENWTLGIINEQNDTKMTCAIYNRMSVLLKSLVSVTRVTPAYKLSRRQGADSFIIYYKIYLGNPQLSDLGEGYKQFTIGQICSSVGTFCMSVAYRTKLTITPQQGASIMLKSDHFHSDLSPKHRRYPKQSSMNDRKWNEQMVIRAESNILLNRSLEDIDISWIEENIDRKEVNLDEPMRPGAFVDVSKIKQYESDFILPEEPPYSWLLEDSRKRDDLDSLGDMTDDEISLKDDYLENMTLDDELSNMSMPDNDKQANTKLQPGTLWSIPPEDAKIMTELPCPFATAGPVGELANFYRECFNAPPLQSFTEEKAPEAPNKEEDDPMFDISLQLEKFENSSQEYDQLVSSLCTSPGNT